MYSLQDNREVAEKLNFKMKFHNFKTEKKEDDVRELNQAISMLIYGTKATKIRRRGKSSVETYFYILEDNPRYLQWLSKNKLYIQSRINLLEIMDITFEYAYKINHKIYQFPLVLHTSHYDLCINFKSQ